MSSDGGPTYFFGVPSGTPSPSVRIVLSEPLGADCIPGGVSPWGLDAGAPPSDFVSIGPVFPWGCVTFLLESVFVDGSLGFDCENAAGTAEKAKAAAMRTRIMAHLRGAHPKSTGRLEFRNYAHLTASR